MPQSPAWVCTYSTGKFLTEFPNNLDDYGAPDDEIVYQLRNTYKTIPHSSCLLGAVNVFSGVLT